MSRISDIAAQLAETHRVLGIADEIALNDAAAKYLHDDAYFISIGLERQLAAEVPASVEDLATQMLVFAGNYLEHMPPDEGCDMDKLHRLMVTRMLEGLLALTSEPSPVAEYYLNPRWFWKDRLAKVAASASHHQGTAGSCPI